MSTWSAILASLSAVTSITLFWVAHSKSSICNALTSALPISEQSLIDQVSSSSSSKSLVGQYVAVEGVVFPIQLDKVLIPKNGSLKGVLLQTQIIRHSSKWNNVLYEWINKTEVMGTTAEALPFKLLSPQDSSKTLVSVYDTAAILRQVGSELTLTSVSSIFTPTTDGGFSKAALDLLQGEKLLGMQVTEHILPVETHLTLFGELAKAPAGEGLQLIVPHRPDLPFVVSREGVSEVLRRHTGSCRNWKIAFLVSCAVTAGLVGYYLYQRRKRQRWREERRSQNLSEAEGEGDRYKCIVCYSHRRDVVILECMHFSCCYQCASRLSTCPVCRSQITCLLRVFQ